MIFLDIFDGEKLTLSFSENLSVKIKVMEPGATCIILYNLALKRKRKGKEKDLGAAPVQLKRTGYILQTS